MLNYVIYPPQVSPIIMLVRGLESGGQIVKKPFTPEQTINKPREVEVLINYTKITSGAMIL